MSYLIKNKMTKYELALHEFQPLLHPSQIRTFTSYKPLIWVLQAALMQRILSNNWPQSWFWLQAMNHYVHCYFRVLNQFILCYPLKLKIPHLNNKKVQDRNVVDPTTMICPHVAPKKNHVMNGKEHAIAMMSVWAL